MHEEDNRSDWYHSQSGNELPERHASPPAAASVPTQTRPPYRPAGASPRYAAEPRQDSPEQKKAARRSTLRTVMICVFVLVLIIATAYIFSQDNAGSSGSSLDNSFDLPDNFPGADDPDGSGLPSDNVEDYDDFNDFFSAYYTDSETTNGENSVERAPTGTGVTLEYSPAGDDTLTLQQIYYRCSPSIVAIAASVDDQSYYWGSGIVMTSDGYIVTNAHLLDGVRQLTVTLKDDSEYDALVVGYDAISDLAVLKIDALGLSPAEFADSSTLAVGDKVVAIGNPLGEEFRGTMTDGIISAINRDIDYNGHTMTVIQTNAAINEGNSGGALINTAGQIIGITNMKMMSYMSSIEGIGFAIPTATMKTVVDALIENGRMLGRPALGITVGAIPQDAADYYSLPDGLYVTDVSDGSDAQIKDVRKGDIITAINDQPVATTADVSAIKDTMQVGDEMALTIYRDGKYINITVELVETSDIY